MTLIDEESIVSLAPSAAAAKNGLQLSKLEKFSNRCQSEDGTLYWADCSGSGSSVYKTSADFTDIKKPVCRCSCPSRQFPCKHSLGLLFEIASGKLFSVTPIPADLQEKRQKNQKSKAASSVKAKSVSSSSTNAAQKKKILKQLEGCELAEKMIGELLDSGLNSLTGTASETYKNAAKNFSNYYLPGIQTSFLRLAWATEQLQTDNSEADWLNAKILQILITLYSTVKKSKAVLHKKLENQESSADDNLLFEALGGIWRSEDLHNLGLVCKNVRLVQLSFDISFDEIKKEYIERSFWIDIDKGTVYHTLNLRPLKALKHIKASDSCTKLLEIPELLIYPGALDRRVRWETCQEHNLTESMISCLPKLAEDSIASAVKKAKGQFKNTLSPKYLPVLLPVSYLADVNGALIIVDKAGNRIEVRSYPEVDSTYDTLLSLRHCPFQITDECAVFGLLFYNDKDCSICFYPYSIITQTKIVRLLF
ncbi:MAG: SWIM zinc finger family protein [Candidatus Bruticola sp.]